MSQPNISAEAARRTPASKSLINSRPTSNLHEIGSVCDAASDAPSDALPSDETAMSAKPTPGYSMAYGYLAYREWLLSRAIFFKLCEGKEDWLRILCAAIVISEECEL
ncbi:hypothetical protein FIBSPDRAFT_945903 [Athelia psychrophila]|uniref:Uncharacterized protein n=1 Tax=Athelia psychrophila TaxID=1759441 RepID=A0A166TF19_9AGAM|nr:hypothetical protein FIBSPDRAFT_945903 [Fibularhizoctonia sp. CBS 109695]